MAGKADHEKNEARTAGPPPKAAPGADGTLSLVDAVGNAGLLRLLRMRGNESRDEDEASRAAARALPGAPSQPLSSGGLDPRAIDHFSRAYGTDLQGVGVHRDSALGASTGSSAATIGDDIFLAPGARPTARLIGHELAHVAQQRHGALGLSGSGIALRGDKPRPEPSGDEPLDPFVTGWTTLPSAVLLVQQGDRVGLYPLANRVFVPDVAGALRYDPTARPLGPSPTMEVPAIGAAGTRIFPAGPRSAIVIDAGAGQGVTAGMYLAQFFGALGALGMDNATSVKIIPVHGHRDHVDRIVPVIRASSVTAANLLIPRGMESIASMRAVVNELRNTQDTTLRGLGFGPGWRPVGTIGDRGSGPEVIRLGYAEHGVRVEMLGLRSAIGAAPTTPRLADRASYLTRVTADRGRPIVILGDLRGSDLGAFRDAMERERAGSWAEFFQGAERISGFSHHVGRLEAGDVAGLMAVLDVTLFQTGSLEIIEQTNLGQFGRARSDTLELLQRLGVTVTTAEQPTTASPTSGVGSTPTGVRARGPDTRVRAPIQSPLTGALSRIMRLRQAKATIESWRPLWGSGTPDQVRETEALMGQIDRDAATLQQSVHDAAQAAFEVRTGGTTVPTGERDYSAGGGTQGAAYDAALRAVPTEVPAERTIGEEGFRELARLESMGPEEVPRAVAIHRALAQGQFSEQAFTAMLGGLNPSTGRSILTEARSRSEAFERVRAQYFLESLGAPDPQFASVAGISSPRGRMAARGVAGGLAVLELWNAVGDPLVRGIQQGRINDRNRNVAPFLRRIAFWARMGVTPKMVAVDDPTFGSAKFERDPDKIASKLSDWDALYIEAPGLEDIEVLKLGLFLSYNVRNFDEFATLFKDSGQDAVHWETPSGQGWENSTWSVHIAHYKTSGVNELVDDGFHDHPRLTQVMRALIPRWMSNTEELLEIQKRGGTPTDEETARLGTFVTLERRGVGGAVLYRARLRTPAASTAVKVDPVVSGHMSQQPLDRTVEWWTQPEFFVREEGRTRLLVSGADYNTYAIIRSLMTESRMEGLPYNTTHVIGNELAMCWIDTSLLERIPEPTPPPTPTPVPAPPRLDQRIFFPFRDSHPRQDSDYDSTPVLDDVADVLRANPTIRVEIGGYTDDVGETSFNRRLSLDRANAVRDALVARGIATERLVPVGHGKDSPIATNATEDGRARNRRVQFTILAPGP